MGCVASTSASDGTSGGGGMCACGGGADPASLSGADAVLAEAQEADKKHHRVLLLGTGESGKSTIIKHIQMQLLKGGIPETSKRSYKDGIRQNCLDCIQALIEATESLEIAIEDESNAKVAEELLDLTLDDFEPDVARKVSQLWHDDSIQAVYERRNEFWLLDACPYYMEHAERVAEEDFEPTDEDIIMTRVRTTGIVETSYQYKDHTITFVDVGGQRSERRKWLNVFDNVDAIVFLSSLAEYNQRLFEDVNVWRIKESLTLFQQIACRKAFARTPIYLVLNKKDIFGDMLKETSLDEVFPEYKGGKDAAKATAFIEDKFRERFTGVSPKDKPLPITSMSARVRIEAKEFLFRIRDDLVRRAQAREEEAGSFSWFKKPSAAGKYGK